MLLVADCSALVALASCDALIFLEPLYGQVIVPIEVFNECCVEGKPYCDILKVYLKDKVKPLVCNNLSSLNGIGIADLGEMQAMQLYKEYNADNLLIDDKKGKKIAQSNHINTIGSLTVLLDAKKAGLTHHIKPLIECIRLSTVFVSDVLLDTILRMADE
jgi:predicted nucleic acid-binding protein